MSSFVGQVCRFISRFKRKKEDLTSDTNFCLFSVLEYTFDAFPNILAVIAPKTPIAITVIISSIRVNPFSVLFGEEFFSLLFFTALDDI